MKGQTIGFQGQRIQICNLILDTIGMVLTHGVGHIMTVHHLVGMKKNSVELEVLWLKTSFRNQILKR